MEDGGGVPICITALHIAIKQDEISSNDYECNFRDGP